MNRVEFPQTVSGFFGILISKSPHKVWDLEHFPMLQKSTLPLSEESVPIIFLLHATMFLKHPLHCWSLDVAPHLLCCRLLYYCPWHHLYHCLICTATPSEFRAYPFLLLEWTLDHPRLFSEVSKLSLTQRFMRISATCSPVGMYFNCTAPCWT